MSAMVLRVILLFGTCSMYKWKRTDRIVLAWHRRMAEYSWWLYVSSQVGIQKPWSALRHLWETHDHFCDKLCLKCEQKQVFQPETRIGQRPYFCYLHTFFACSKLCHRHQSGAEVTLCGWFWEDMSSVCFYAYLDVVIFCRNRVRNEYWEVYAHAELAMSIAVSNWRIRIAGSSSTLSASSASNSWWSEPSAAIKLCVPSKWMSNLDDRSSEQQSTWCSMQRCRLNTCNTHSGAGCDQGKSIIVSKSPILFLS